MNKYLKYSLRILGILIGTLLLLYLIAYLYVVAHKKELIAKAKKEVSEKINGDVEIGDFDISWLSSFPSLSLVLEKVSIKDTLFRQHHHPFFEADKVYSSIGVMDLINKNNPLNSIRIEKAQLYVFVDTSGYTNSYLFSPKKKDTVTTNKPQKELNIESIKLQDVRLVLDNRMKGKLFDFEVHSLKAKIKGDDSIIRLDTKNNILVHSLMFKQEKGSFLKETSFEGNIGLVFNKSMKQLRFDNAGISLNKQSFTITGAFNFVDSPTFHVNLTTKNIRYDFARKLLADQISKALSLVKIEDPVNEVTADISGPLKGGQPLVNIQWKLTSGNNVQSPFVSVSDCELTGSFVNEIVKGEERRDENSRIHLHAFKAKWEGIDVASNDIYIDNLKVPSITADVKAAFDAAQLNDVLGSNTVDLQEGKGKVDITYTGPLVNNSNRNTLINGKISFSNALVAYVPRGIAISNASCNVVFKNTDVFVTDLRGTVKGNRIIMNGSGRNLLALMETSPGKAFVEWNVYSPSLNLGTLTTLLKQRTSVRTNKKSKLGQTANNIDRIVNLANFGVNVKADELIYQQFRATNVRASLGLLDENWVLNNVSLQHAGGSMLLKGSLREKTSKTYDARVQVNMENMDVNRVMHAFSNFGQSGIAAENLRGKLTSFADVRMDIDRDLNPHPENIEGVVDFSLKDGALLHYEPLAKVQNVVFKKRNFDEIHFAELKDKLEINNGEIKINRMEIQSSVLTLFVEGVYSMRGNTTDISIQVPLSNLKKRGEDYVPENKGAAKKGGMSIFVRGQPGKDGNVQFKLDVFKKFRKKKETDNKESL